MFKEKYKSLTSIVSALFIIAVVLFLIFFKIIIISGQSMSPTYHDKQVILISKVYSQLNRNDVIVCTYNNMEIIKRIVGCPGDIIELKDGYVYRNSVKLSYTYDGTDEKKYTLSDDEYFVIGDNYNASTDSRVFGPIKNNAIIGRAI